MQIIQGNIWKAPLPVAIVITTNSQLKENGDLVMGAGIALEAAQKLPTLPALCGKIVQQLGPNYGFEVVTHPRTPGKAGLCIFQVKHSWMDNASLELIDHSAAMLAEHAGINADIPFRLNFPGIGFGRLTKEQVLPILTEHFDRLENMSIYYI